MEEEIVVKEEATEDQVKESDVLEGSSGVQSMSRRTYNPESPSFSETIRNLIFDEDGELIEESETEDDPSPTEPQPGPSTRDEHPPEVSNPELPFDEDFDAESDGEIPDFDDNSEDDPDYEPDSEPDSERDSSSGDDEELLERPRSFINIERLENTDLPVEVPPTFLGKNDFEWSSEPPNNRVRTSASNIIRGLPGIRGPARNLGPSPSALELWEILVDNEIVSKIVTWTNKKLADLRQNIQGREGVRGDLKVRYLRRYGDTNSTEINALCGVLLLTSILKGDHEDVGSLFTSGSTGRPIFGAVL
ncbi:hypothetical protein GE061_008721 [Apolygus lucorum]|uniref:PiggyBac transposable element-derived protein domain-containing protein n=1 Tax=Apolygus lucorum TaxID=248454 RepID=A0A8S9WQR3_APOLU|nr:hypothetical protein GE061_008721 [Apolygus lucorum]